MRHRICPEIKDPHLHAHPPRPPSPVRRLPAARTAQRRQRPTAAASKFILIDGGPARVYKAHLKPELARLAAAGATLDRVLLTHVDDDHVKGLLDLFNDLARQQKAGQDPVIAVDGLWHNTFTQVVGGEAALRARGALPAAVCDGLLIPKPESAGLGQPRSIKQGDQLTKLAAQAGVRVNADFTPPGVIAAAAPPPVIDLDGARLTVIGPTPAQLEDLREEWLDWLAQQAARPRGMAPDTSVPNLSSVVVLVEADGRRLLLTGDARGATRSWRAWRRRGILTPRAAATWPC